MNNRNQLLSKNAQNQQESANQGNSNQVNSTKQIKNSNQNSMTIIAQLFKSLILAQIIANITPSLANISNGLLIGNSLSPTAMAALSFVAPTGGLFAAIAAVISLGANILCGNCMGRGEEKEIHRIFTTAIVTITGIGVVLTAATELFPGQVAALLGAEGEALPETIAYLRGLCIGTLPTLLVPCLVVFLNMANEITYAMFSTIVLAMVNLLVGLLNLKLFDGGMFGMGLASAISEYAAMFFLLAKFVTKKSLARLQKDGFVLRYVWKIVVLGSPSALMFFLYSIRNIQINTLSFETGGTSAVTALGILSSSAGIFDAVNTGIGSTLVMLASVMAGEEDRDSLKKLMKYTLTFGGVLVLIKTAVFASLANPIALLFGAQGEDIHLAMVCVWAYALCMPFNLIPIVLIKIYQCLDRVALSNVLYVLTCIVFPIGIMRILSPAYGIYGVWSCYMLSEVFTILVLFIICWYKSGHLPVSCGDWLWLEKTFAGSERDQYTAVICSEETAEDAAAQVGQFLQEHGLPEETSLSSLELLRLVWKDFLARQKGNVLETLITRKDGELLIRFRDNLLEKDRSGELRELLQKEGPASERNRMELKYQSTFGRNVLTLKLPAK